MASETPAGDPANGASVRVPGQIGGPYRARLPLPSAEIVAAYVAGESEQSIARRYGVGRGAIRPRLLEAGLKLRTMAEAQALRMAKLTPDERSRNALAAQAAVRGGTRGIAELERRAITRQARRHGISENERQLARWLVERGRLMTPQLAIGPYNCDLGAYPVAVEINGGNWHAHGRHAGRAAERTRHILDAGWNLIIVWAFRQHPLTVGAAEYIAAFAQQAGRDESVRGQYRVIRGGGDDVTPDRFDLDEVALVPSASTGKRRTPRHKRVAG